MDEQNRGNRPNCGNLGNTKAESFRLPGAASSRRFVLHRARGAMLWERIAAGQAAITRLGDRLLLLPAAYFVLMAAILLTNSIDAPTFLYVAVVIPIATLTLLPFAWRVGASSRIFWAIAVYLFVIGIASVVLPDIPQRILNRHLRMSPMILYFVIITACLTVRSRRGFAYFLLLLISLLSISAAVNSVTFIREHPFSMAALPDFRLLGSLGMPESTNATSLSITYAVYFAAALAMASNDSALWRRIIFAGLAVVMLAGVLMTQARSAYLAVALSAAAVLAGAAFAGAMSRRTTIALLLGVASVAIIVLLVPDARRVVAGRGFSHRPEIWVDFVSMMTHHPLLGYGITPDIHQVMRDGEIVDHPHNIVLSSLVRGGIIGGAAMLTIFLGCLYWSWRFWMASGQIAPLCMMVAMATASMFDYELPATNPSWAWVTFWVPIGIGIGTELVGRSAIEHQGT